MESKRLISNCFKKIIMPKFKYTIIFQIIFFITAINLSAQENSRKKFTLNGHEFLSTSAVENLNIETVLFSKLSMGSTGQLVSNGIMIGDDEILSFTGSLLYTGATVSYKQKVNDWFAIYIETQFVGRVGTHIPTLFAEGINTAGGSEIGWMFRMYQYEKGYLSGAIFTTRYAGSIINISKYIIDLIEGNPNAKVIDKVPVSFIGARINYAHAFNKTWGAQFDAAFGYGEKLKRTQKDIRTDLGLFVEANLYPDKKIPLGFGLGYNLSSMPETIYNEDRFANIFFFNMAYTKASDFELGVEIQYFKVPLSGYKSTPTVFSANLMMRFNF